MFIIAVQIDLKPEAAAEYKMSILKEVEHAMTMESGIVGFHVWEDDANPNHLSIYEIYRDEEALKFHHAQSYFKEFVASHAQAYTKAPSSARSGTIVTWGAKPGPWTNAKHAPKP